MMINNLLVHVLIIGSAQYLVKAFRASNIQAFAFVPCGLRATSTEQETPQPATSSYDTSSPSSKGLVSALTDLVNGFNKSTPASLYNRGPAPMTKEELMKFLDQDYTVNNYLWTGDLSLEAFDEQCTFQDPTISFQGLSTYHTNVQNLAKVVRWATNNQVEQKTKSILLDIQCDEHYVETRWNMVGELTALPWNPCIDVIGRTKFWYRSNSQGELKVYKYDEEWEMSAAKALWQLVTPSSASKKLIEF